MNIKKILLIIGVILIGLVIIGTLNRDPISLSKDQKDLVSSFGHPDTFILIMDDEMRYETWAYHTMERTFSFMDGIFLEEGTISDFENEEMVFTEFKPTQFKNKLLLADINKILGEPSKMGEIDSDLLEDAEIYNYHNQVMVGIKNNQVVYIQTLPVLMLTE